MSPYFRLQHLTAYPHWHTKPFLLSEAEMARPQKVFTDFFNLYDLSDIRICLRQWLGHALPTAGADAASHLQTHEDVGKLVEAAWVLWQSGSQSEADEGFTPVATALEREDKAALGSPPIEHTERRRFVKWMPLPAHLKAQPLAYLQKLFDHASLDQLDGWLQHWQRLALSAGAGRYNEPEERADLLDFCAAYLHLLPAVYVLQKTRELEGTIKWVLTEDLKYDLMAGEKTYRISEEAIGDPYEVIRGFFRTFSPAYARRELWDMLACAIEAPDAEVKKLDLLTAFEYLEAVMEGAWLVHRQAVKSGVEEQTIKAEMI